MQIDISAHEGYYLARTNGPIDDAAREPFRDQLHPLVGTSGTRLILDLSQSTRINSLGVGHLVTLVSHANANASRVILCAVPPFVSVVFSVTKLDRFFDIAATTDDAVALLRGERPASDAVVSA